MLKWDNQARKWMHPNLISITNVNKETLYIHLTLLRIKF